MAKNKPFTKEHYFRHDNNARNDFKILSLREQFGLKGYALYFMLLEVMNSTESGMLEKSFFAGISQNFRIKLNYFEKFLHKCVSISLFQEDEFYIYSRRLLVDIESQKWRKERAKQGAETTNEIKRQKREITNDERIANAMRTDTARNKEKEEEEEEEYQISKDICCPEVEKTTSELEPENILFKFQTRKNAEDKTDGKIYNFLKTDLNEYQKIYNLVDVEAELRKMQAWFLAKPERKKTFSGMKRFINTWLSKIQTRKEINNENGYKKEKPVYLQENNNKRDKNDVFNIADYQESLSKLAKGVNKWQG